MLGCPSIKIGRIQDAEDLVVEFKGKSTRSHSTKSNGRIRPMILRPSRRCLKPVGNQADTSQLRNKVESEQEMVMKCTPEKDLGKKGLFSLYGT